MDSFTSSSASGEPPPGSTDTTPLRDERIAVLDGVRGYAVLLVFLVHHHSCFGAYLPPLGILRDLSRLGGAIGHSGVDIFFVLSGYLIYGQLMRRPVPYMKFLRRRIRRIYPTFLFVLSVYVALCYAIPSVSKLPHTANLQALYLIQNVLLLPGLFDIEPLVTVTWSLSYEFLFYLTIPLLISLTGMRRWQRRTRILFLLAVFSVHSIGYAVGAIPHVRLSTFIPGCVLYEAIDCNRAGTLLSAGGEHLVLLLYAGILLLLGWITANRLMIVNLSVPVAWTVLLSMVLPLMLFYAMRLDGLLKRFYGLDPLRALGHMSYSYFLTHGLMLNSIAFFVRYQFPGQTPSAPLFLCLLTLNLTMTLAGSFPVYALIEKPISLARSLPVAAACFAGSAEAAVARSRHQEV